MMKFNLIKFFFVSVLGVLPVMASASYICNCYTDLRPYGQGLVFQGQAEAPVLSASSYYCNLSYKGARVASCYEDSSANYSSPSTSSSSSESSNDSKTKSDCIKAPAGIAEACLQAFEPEYNRNQGQTEIVRDTCITMALSVPLVKRCLKKFPLHSTSDEKATYNRINCIVDQSSKRVGDVQTGYRCSM